MGKVSDVDAYQCRDDTDTSRSSKCLEIVVTPLCDEYSQSSNEASYGEPQLRSPKDAIKNVLILRNTAESPSRVRTLPRQ